MEIEGQSNKRPRHSFDRQSTTGDDNDDSSQHPHLNREKSTTRNDVTKKKKPIRPSVATIANGILQQILRPDLEIPNGTSSAISNNSAGCMNANMNVDMSKRNKVSSRLNGNGNGGDANIGNNSSGVEVEAPVKPSPVKTSKSRSPGYGIRQTLSHSGAQMAAASPNRMNGISPRSSNGHLNGKNNKSAFLQNGNPRQIANNTEDRVPQGVLVNSGKKVNGDGACTQMQNNVTTEMNGVHNKRNGLSNHHHSQSSVDYENRAVGQGNMPQNNGVSRINDVPKRNEANNYNFKSNNANGTVRENNKACSTDGSKESTFRGSTFTNYHKNLEMIGPFRSRYPVKLGNSGVGNKRNQDTLSKRRSSTEERNHTNEPTKHTNEPTKNDGVGRESLKYAPNNSSVSASMNENTNGDQPHNTKDGDGSKMAADIEYIYIDDSDSDDKGDIKSTNVTQNEKTMNSNSSKKQNPKEGDVNSIRENKTKVQELAIETSKTDRIRTEKLTGKKERSKFCQRQNVKMKITRDINGNGTNVQNRFMGPRINDEIRTVTGIEKERIISSNLFQKQDLKMKHVRRVDVNEPNVKEYVTECRRNGTPVVLIGHKGWVNFARPWLKELRRDNKSVPATRTSLENIDIDLKHPTYRYEIDVDQMIEHIGMEEVPILRKNYNERNPISHKAKASHFLKKHFRSVSDECVSDFYYLHQWQFPLSETAGRKLCAQCKPMPNDIFGEDILKYYLGEEMPHCPWDNPFQYIFMGAGGTKSKLHQDPGGLEITIAVITGEKECILVHRDDGFDCFYDLDASLDDVDLEKYPLMTQARIWKTTIKPGDILLMPQGTYHQCRNTTSCLSYSRFILDTVNLLPFYKSFQNGDAKEIQHEEILWNCAIELVKKVDKYTDDYQQCLREGSTCPTLEEDIIRGVETLQSLRHFFRDIAKKGEKVYTTIVEDIDDTLHTFQYRSIVKIPLHRIM